MRFHVGWHIDWSLWGLSYDLFTDRYFYFTEHSVHFGPVQATWRTGGVDG